LLKDQFDMERRTQFNVVYVIFALLAMLVL